MLLSLTTEGLYQIGLISVSTFFWPRLTRLTSFAIGRNAVRVQKNDPLDLRSTLKEPVDFWPSISILDAAMMSLELVTEWIRRTTNT